MSLYILFSNFSAYSPNFTRIHVELFLNMTKCGLDGFDFLLANKDASSL